MAKNDEDLIFEAYKAHKLPNNEQLNEGILARTRAGLNDSLIGRAVNTVGNVLTGNTQGLKDNLSKDSAHMKFDSLLKSHTASIQKPIKKFVQDLIKSGILNAANGAKIEADTFEGLINAVQTQLGSNKGTVLSRGANAIGQGVSNVANAAGNVISNTGQAVGNVAGKAAAGVMNAGTAAKNAYNQNRI